MTSAGAGGAQRQQKRLLVTSNVVKRHQITDKRSDYLRARTPPLYLSKRAPATKLTSRGAPLTKLDDGKHGAVKNSVSKRRPVMVPGQQLPRARSIYEFTTPGKDLQGPALATDSGMDHPLKLKTFPHSGNELTQSESERTQAKYDLTLQDFPLFPSEVSVAASPAYVGSPFSHTTTISSQTSYSPLYPSTSPRTDFKWTSPISGIGSSSTLTSDVLSSQPPTISAEYCDTTSPNDMILARAPACDSALTRVSKDKSEHSIVLDNVRSEVSETTKYIKQTSRVHPAMLNVEPILEKTNVVTPPPELAHLITDIHGGNNAPPTATEFRHDPLHACPTSPHVVSQISGRTHSKLEEFFGEPLPKGCIGVVKQQNPVQPSPPPRQPQKSNRVSFEYRLTPSLTKTSRTAVTTSSPLSDFSRAGKPKTAISLLSHDKLGPTGTTTADGCMFAHSLKTRSSTKATNTIDKSSHGYGGDSNDIRHNANTASRLPTARHTNKPGAPIDDFLASRLDPIYLRTLNKVKQEADASMNRILVRYSSSSNSDPTTSQSSIEPSTVTRIEQVQSASMAGKDIDICPTQSDSAQGILHKVDATKTDTGVSTSMKTPAQSGEPQKHSTTNVTRPSWFFHKQKPPGDSPNPHKGFFRRALASARRPLENVDLVREVKGDSIPSSAQRTRGPSQSILNTNSSALQSLQRGRTTFQGATQRERTTVHDRAMATSNNEPSSSMAQRDAPRRSSSILRTSLDAISRGRQVMQRSQVSRIPRVNPEAERTPSTIETINLFIATPEVIASTVSVPIVPQEQAASDRSTDQTRESVVTTNATTTTVCPQTSSTAPNGRSATSTNVDLLEHRRYVASENKHHLSQVVEEEFLVFSTTTRDSMSSDISSPETFYFPIAPSRPPTASLPKIPQETHIYTAANTCAIPSVTTDSTNTNTNSTKSIALTNASPFRAEKITQNGGTTDSQAPSHANVAKRRTDRCSTKLSRTAKPASGPSLGTALQSSKTTGLLSGRWESTTRAIDTNDATLTDMRFASLMTSKWLSFGRVLFSPVHTELKAREQDRILVIDGLGSDWSHYCALTYPHVQVHLLATGSLLQEQASICGSQAPSNFCSDLRPVSSSRFPYSSNYFAATIVRFPQVTTNTNMRLLIEECTRVLRPGGYLETSVIDLDLANMGYHGRKAARELKTRLFKADPYTCLKPVTDHIQFLLGRCGYEKLSRCIIGVPAAGPVASSRPTSSDDKKQTFEDLIKDESERGDKGIVNMVSKVGQFWYEQCYEQGRGASSIWNDKSLAKECEELRTAFKLLVCYAQKPEPIRKTSSG